MSRPFRTFCFVALAFVVAPPVGPSAARQAAPPSGVPALDAPPSLVFARPVGGEVVDGWRPPGHEYGPGNRGWEYATERGTPVGAAGDGVVSFAGSIGEEQYVTVTHRGGLRTSYSYLASIVVTEGSDVERGDPVGTSGERLHFGVRLGDDYVDPDVLFRPGALRGRARLVPTAG